MEEKTEVQNDEFKDFYEKYFMVIYKYIYRKIKNQQVAEDIAQETFYLAYVRWRDVKEHPSPLGWLLKTAQYKMLEVGRKIYSISEMSLEEVQDAVEEPPDYGLRELEISALVILKPDEWSLIKKHYLWGYSVRDLAKEEGVTENTLRVRMFRILKRLRNVLNGLD